MWCIYYHVIYTEITGVCFQQQQKSHVKVTAVFVPKLSGPRCVYYHAIYEEVIDGRGMFSITKFPQVKVTKYQVLGVYIAMLFTQTLLGLYFIQLLSSGQSYRGVHM